MSRQVQLLKQELTITQILRTYGKRFTQVRKRYSDGHNGRCAVGIIMSYHGWNGKDDLNAAKILSATLLALRHVGIDKNLLIELNDSGLTFDEITDNLDGHHELPDLK